MKYTKVLSKAVLRNTMGQILLLRRSKSDDRRPLEWDFPGGGVENDEDFVLAAVREIKEESDIKIMRSDLNLVYSTCEITEYGNICWLTFIGETAQTKVSLSLEHDQFKWVSLEEAIELVTYHRQNKALRYISENNLFD